MLLQGNSKPGLNQRVKGLLAATEFKLQVKHGVKLLPAVKIRLKTDVAVMADSDKVVALGEDLGWLEGEL